MRMFENYGSTLGGPSVTVRDNKDYNRALLYSYYATILGWGVLLNYGSTVYVCPTSLRNTFTEAGLHKLGANSPIQP